MVQAGQLIHRLSVAEMCSMLKRMYVQRASGKLRTQSVEFQLFGFFREGRAWLIGDVEKFFEEKLAHSVQPFITCLLAVVHRQRTSIDERAKSLYLTMSPCSRWTGAKDSPAPKTVEVTQLQYSCMTRWWMSWLPSFPHCGHAGRNERRFGRPMRWPPKLRAMKSTTTATT